MRDLLNLAILDVDWTNLLDGSGTTLLNKADSFIGLEAAKSDSGLTRALYLIVLARLTR